MSGRLRTASREVELGEVAAVYYRRPTPYAARFEHLPPQQRDFCVAEARHGLGGVLNHLHGAAYVNHPAAVTRADFKPAQLARFAELGLTIPPTLVTTGSSLNPAVEVEGAARSDRVEQGLEFGGWVPVGPCLPPASQGGGGGEPGADRA